MLKAKLKSLPVERMRGEVRPPGDKSISHRALILGSLCQGRVEISGLAQGADVRATAWCLARLGVDLQLDGCDALINGQGLGGFRQPDSALDCGNSGTTLRLLSGLVAGARITTTLGGDKSLQKRPMGRISAPLRKMGALIGGPQDGTRAPLYIECRGVRPRLHRLEIASAQVKSMILIAGGFAHGLTQVEEPAPTRDHTERMLCFLGADLCTEFPRVSLRGPLDLGPAALRVPGDPSSAAFLCAAAPFIRRSRVVVRDLCLNPTRTGFLEVLRNMGARFETQNLRDVDGEPVGDLVMRYGALRGCTILGRLVPRTIDELVVLALIASMARGETVIKDAAELRHKESDRIAGTVDAINALGGSAEATDDGMLIHGLDGPLLGGTIRSRGDHRLALAALAIGAVTQRGVSVEGAEAIAVSYPEFVQQFNSLGGSIQ
ncbi:MAG: 3-phosphoshikimate 1-carboxyvinyltransferase [Candidatus Alcyoniella australis]|nr:3-phosphoshikimate 1-carboxyvinyltransferase [Candidatus Alcyoniella australis]